MSGGRYNYLCCKDGLGEILERKEELKEMSGSLHKLGYVEAAQETEGILTMINLLEAQIKEKIDKLKDVWWAIEWFDSSDISLEGVKKVMEEYKKNCEK